MSRTQAHLVNAALVVAVGVAFWWAFAHAFADAFSCRSLIVDRYDVDGAVCEGAIGTGGRVGDVLDMVGVDADDTLVPGLESLIDGPLGVVRQVTIGVYLVLVLGVAAVATFVIRNLGRLIRLIRLDPEEWDRFASALRTYLLVVLALYGLTAATLALV